MSFMDKLNHMLGADKPKLSDFYALFDQLYMLMNSGSNLQQALLDISHVQTNKRLGEALKNIARSLTSGVSTGAAFKKEEVFPRMIAPTIDAGDRAGRLTDTFLRLSERITCTAR